MGLISPEYLYLSQNANDGIYTTKQHSRFVYAGIYIFAKRIYAAEKTK
jgi:hypothetical protein